jgi:hypothetical protein
MRNIWNDLALLCHSDWCFVSLGGLEFAQFSEPLEADIKTRANGEYLWGRQFVLCQGSAAPC